MKEIEFRVYVKDKRKIYNVKEIDFAYKCVKFEEENKPTDTMRMFEDVELLQYTGLKDKNGKKIFEGDIISANHYPFIDDNKQNYVGVIEYIPELASFQYILNCVNPDKNGISNGINEELEANENLILEEFEVIGNIWDNTELIGA